MSHPQSAGSGGSPPVLAATLWSAAVALLFSGGYSLTNAHAALARPVRVALPWDFAVPFWAWTIVPYLSLNLLLPMALFACPDRRALAALAWRAVAVMLVCFAVFWHWPTASVHTLPQPGLPWRPFFDGLRAFEQPVNQIPSLHVAIGVLVWRALLPVVPARLRPLWHGWCALMAVSTLTTWQHGLADVLAGATLGALAWYGPWPLGMRGQHATAPGSPSQP
ncbi:MAG: phosphatase PAP2 family protein [Acidovorax sp.]|uniref:phosphatase PAP2 family protein n=1 Tax=Acidovorax sp. TaxID=1872122 RepID=UPI0039E4268A